MTFDAILPELKAGKKIRRACWAQGDYLLWRCGRLSIWALDNWGKVTSVGVANLMAEDWEVYEEMPIAA